MDLSEGVRGGGWTYWTLRDVESTILASWRWWPAISGMLSLVQVMSLVRKMTFSTGTISSTYSAKQHPISVTATTICSAFREQLNPGIDSSFSRVPPACPASRSVMQGTCCENKDVTSYQMHLWNQSRIVFKEALIIKWVDLRRESKISLCLFQRLSYDLKHFLTEKFYLPSTL